MANLLKELIAHLTVNKARIMAPLKVRGHKDDGWVSDAGTWWPPETTTIGEVETIDFEKLLQEIDRFSETFNG